MMKHVSLFTILITLLTATSAFSQIEERSIVQEDLPIFRINIQLSATKVLLECPEGCAWTELSYAINEANNMQGVNQLGLTTEAKHQTLQDETLAPFYFTIEKQNTQWLLKGTEGVAWDTLSTSCLKPECFIELNAYGFLE